MWVYCFLALHKFVRGLLVILRSPWCRVNEWRHFFEEQGISLKDMHQKEEAWIMKFEEPSMFLNPSIQIEANFKRFATATQ